MKGNNADSIEISRNLISLLSSILIRSTFFGYVFYSYRCLALHGGMDQADRDSAIVDFKNGDIDILVATSVAARGLDVKRLRVVINYDVPNHYEDYVHRVGRTGRAGNKGTAYTFITKEQVSDKDVYACDIILQKKGREFSDR